MNNPMVTIIIPAKNEEKIIGKCLKALANLEYPREQYEVIVVDNGSTDSTTKIVDDYGFIAYTQPGITISGLRNFGAISAKGVILAFVDADVVVEPEWLENGIAALSEAGVACVGCSPEIPRISTWVERAWNLQIKGRPEKSDREWLASMNLLVWKKYFFEVNGFNENLCTCEDVDFGYRISRKYRIVSDKKIRAVHYGEAKTLIQFFKKESWRGISNFQGVVSHGIVLNEIPSHAVVLYYFLFISTAPVLAVCFNDFFIHSLLLASVYPVLKTVAISYKNKSIKYVFQLMVLWSIYCVARGWSVWRVLFRRFEWAYAR
jgi:glycosyltransferase involved in cell wall biosynthesis